MQILKFGAIWCKECLVMRPIWSEIESGMPELKTKYYDADENFKKLKKYNIKNIPVFIFLDKNNNEIIRLNGIKSKNEIEEIIKKNINK